MPSVACRRTFGPYSRCGVPLDITTVDGTLVVGRCWACDRLARGICRDCPLPVYGVVGKARRCAVHHRIEANRREKVRMRRPDERKRNLQQMRAWRKAHPDRVRATLKAQRVREKLRVLRGERRAA